jgi:hypothetical protein
VPGRVLHELAFPADDLDDPLDFADIADFELDGADVL